MKTIKFTTTAAIVTLTLFLVSFEMKQQVAVPDEIYAAIKAGNSKVLAKYFNTNVELVIHFSNSYAEV